MWLGAAIGGAHMWLNDLGLGFLAPWTTPHAETNHETLPPVAECKKPSFPKPDRQISFDRLSSVFLSNTNHEEDQPVYLRLKDP